MGGGEKDLSKFWRDAGARFDQSDWVDRTQETQAKKESFSNG
jgi:hypothetical protein